MIMKVFNFIGRRISLFVRASAMTWYRRILKYYSLFRLRYLDNGLHSVLTSPRALLLFALLSFGGGGVKYVNLGI